MSPRPRLSVLIPNFNNERHIGRAIEAIAAQSRQPDELVIVDDGSTDDSLSIIEKFAARFPFIQCLRHDRNRGVLAAQATGLVACTGEYLYGAGGDDYVLPGFFENAMALVEEFPQAGIVFGGLRTVDSEGKELGRASSRTLNKEIYLSPEQYLRDVLDAESPLFSPSAATIYRRSALSAVGGFKPELGSWADTFSLHAIALADGACYLPRLCVTCSFRESSFSARTLSDIRQVLDIIGRATWLMRSAEFRERFPEASVERWELEYKKEVIGRHLAKFATILQDLRYRIRYSVPTEQFIYTQLAKILDIGIRIWGRICRTLMNKSIWSYEPDISCYISNPK